MQMQSFAFDSRRAAITAGLLLISFSSVLAGAKADRVPFRAPPGFVVEKVAGPPLTNYPMLACFDDRGRLFVAEGTGTNLPGKELVKIKRGRITLLEDTDGDGRFDASTVFADEFVSAQGVLWHDGVVYVASHPNIWRLEDTDGDGRADQRDVLVGEFGFNGNGCDIHGPFLGPDGRLYWTDGRHGYKITTREGTRLEGFAARIWRCKPDGTEIERICGGGFDNPVEIAFLADGGLIGTMDQGPGDALLHYIEGGVYPRDDQPCMKEFAMTGPPLGAVSQYTAALPVALCGLTRYRSAHFGEAYTNSLFSAQFNVHRIQQHVLVPAGATYRSVDTDFLTSLDYDVHPTDVLEDADGSLLVIDMGAWFNFGCPTSKIAKPEIKGRIYRVRRENASPVKDPWGRSLKLASMPSAELVALLDDPRAKVRDRVIARLAKLGPAAVLPLAGVCGQDGDGLRSVQARRNAVWALVRIETAEAMAAVRGALTDKDASVRSAAAHSVGLVRDVEATAALGTMVVEDTPALRLKAAEALGRIGRSVAIPALLGSLRTGSRDRFLEHALIYALIQIGDRDATAVSLNDANPQVRRAGLIALDQMEDGRLTRDMIVPLLDTDDLDLQQTTLEVISRHEGWGEAITGLLEQWLSNSTLAATRERSLTGALLAYCRDPAIRKLMTGTLAESGTTTEMRLLLLNVMARCRLDRLPDPWLERLSKATNHADPRVQREAVAVIQSRGLTTFDGQLAAIARDEDRPAELRIAALGCIAPRQGEQDADAFALLMAQLQAEGDPLLRVAAARVLGASSLTREQLLELAVAVADASPLRVGLLAPAFGKCDVADVGLALVEALNDSPGSAALPADQLSELLKSYPRQVQSAAKPLLKKAAARGQKKKEYLTTLTQQLLQTPGNADRGRKVFHSKQVGCYTCHRINGEGGSAGPDLSKIGQIRWPNDLLEAIVFPSASMAQDYRPYRVQTKSDGQVFTGIITREGADAIYLRTSQLAEIRIARKDVDVIGQSTISIMPQGLEKAMTPQQLSDLLEFLYHCR